MLYHKSELPLAISRQLKPTTTIVNVYKRVQDVKLSTIKGIPIVQGHSKWCGEDNCKPLGRVITAKIKRGFIVADLELYEPIGETEVSLGYNAEFTIANNKIYHTNITYNHLALVSAGRCGSMCYL
jgi:hypothetical protein